MAGLPVASYENAKPQILIGLDNGTLAVPLEVRQGSNSEPIATKSKLGWVIQGLSGDRNELTMHHNYHACSCQKSDKLLHDLVKDFYAIENFGVRPFNNIIESSETKQAHRLLQDTTKKVGERFETGLLWRTKMTNFLIAIRWQNDD